MPAAQTRHMLRHEGCSRLAFLTSSDANIHILSPNDTSMGCNLRELATPENIDLATLSGQRVGIDAFLTAFQFLTTMRDRSPQGDGGPLRSDDGTIVSHLMGFLHRTTALLALGIKPVYIFDGQSPELKRDEIEMRRARRVEAERIHQEAIAAGDFALAQKMAPRIMYYSQEMVDETKKLLDLLGVPWVVAAAEGEGQAAVMAARGQLDVVATQDWDALLYGTPRLVRNLMSDGTKQHGRTVNAQMINLGDMLESHDLSREQLIDLAIMIGTDFHPGIKGIGPKTGIKLIKSLGTIEAICQEKGKEVPERLDEIREIFHNHPAVEVADEDLLPGTIDVKGLTQFLQVERQFSQRRMDNALDKLRDVGLIREGGQTSLFSF
ncbi:MAG: flap endonuclease-1 [Euryarchaeota archaeon]|nr:flap endonuclease-1 [Euryarchaeota archaeon]